MPYIDIHNERVWIPERPLRSMDEARPMRDGDLWRCLACGRELDEEENDDGTITLVCPAHQVGWDAGHEDEPYPMGGLVFRPTMDGGPATLVCLRCGLERPLEPVAGPPEPYTRAVRALDMLADALDEDVMP
uniref:hypothetical protein n=1 Tax=Bifidobacterium adolescentis TaxID=1680 RepID=UPI003FF0BF0C